MDLANKVRRRREELGWSQEELATKMGYSSRTSINKIEMGRPCSQKIIARLAEALDVSIAYLMDWESIDWDPQTQEITDNSECNYYEEQDAKDLAEFLFKNPEYRILFDASKKVKAEDIIKAVTALGLFAKDDDGC